MLQLGNFIRENAVVNSEFSASEMAQQFAAELNDTEVFKGLVGAMLCIVGTFTETDVTEMFPPEFAIKMQKTTLITYKGYRRYTNGKFNADEVETNVLQTIRNNVQQSFVNIVQICKELEQTFGGSWYAKIVKPNVDQWTICTMPRDALTFTALLKCFENNCERAMYVAPAPRIHTVK